MWWMAVAVAKPSLGTLEIAAPPGGGLCPGAQLALDVTSVAANGKRSAVRLGGSKAAATAQWELGDASTGKITMPADARVTWGKAGTLTVTAVDDPSVRASIDIPVRYDCQLVVPYLGVDGQPGDAGQDGVTTAAQGGAGEDGHQGEPGGDAPALEVRVVAVEEPRLHQEVLQVEIERVDGEGEPQFYAVALTGSDLVVVARGGSGGVGGKGGDGGAAGSSGRDSGSGGSGGAGGSGGQGGVGGVGGAVTFVLDPSADGRSAVVGVDNHGGAGGPAGPGGTMGMGTSTQNTARPGREGAPGPRGNDGPAPVVRVEPLGPLW